MRQVSPAAMKSGSGIEPDGHIQEPVHGHEQREDSNAATFPSDGAPSALAADASSQPPLPAAPVGRPQERGREEAGGGSGGTHGPSSAAAGADQKLAAIPFLAPSPSSSVGSTPSTPSPGGASAFGAGTSSSAAGSAKGVKWRHPVVEATMMVPKEARRPFQCKLVFEYLEREKAAINEADRRWAEEEEKKKKPEDEQVKSSHVKEVLWSKFKNYFTRKKKDKLPQGSQLKNTIVDREGRQIYSEHVGHQTLPITDVTNHYHVPEDMAIRVNLDAYSRFRPVIGYGECFYRSFMFSYLEQVLDRQDIHEERRLLDTVKRVSMQHGDLGWTSEFSRSYKAFKTLIQKVKRWKRHGRWNSIASTNSYRKEKLLEFFSTYDTTEDIFVFLRLVAAIQICSHREDYEPLISGLRENYSLKDWCFRRVTPSRKFTDHVMMTALVRALEVPLKVERLYGGCAQDIYTGPGVPRVSVTLMYTGNHYDIIYPRAPAESSSQQASQREHPAD